MWLQSIRAAVVAEREKAGRAALLLLPLRPGLRLARSVSRGQDTDGTTSGLCHATMRDIVTGISRDSVTQSPGGRHITIIQCWGVRGD